eukprot:gnl/Chilomastix_caulleri/2616.p3 GENE.gnl/Chilomastix_caulleri/2616~~gnl/Chilomastix_caulleri/2616.p3  ORF type:complete len:50 (-),score=2.74 gnl/Chilomastix_caulleri/2616:16-165(-)
MITNWEENYIFIYQHTKGYKSTEKVREDGQQGGISPVFTVFVSLTRTNE